MCDISFNCDVCGRQVYGWTFVNGMKFCAKCYQETFGNTAENLNNIYEGYLKILNEKDQRIAELEKQLKEKDNEHTKEMMAFEKKCQAYYNSKGFAIEQLEKVKEEFNSRKLEYKSCTTGNHCYGLRIDRINELIDSQIEELKKENRCGEL